MKHFAAAALMFVGSAQAGSIYLCKAYNGGTFWAQAHCNQHNALIESIVSVPDGLPWEQQVSLAEQQRHAVSSSAPRVVQQNSGNEHVARQAECKALDARVMQHDAMARQPQSGQTHDWIRSERKTARDRQFQIRCQ